MDTLIAAALALVDFAHPFENVGRTIPANLLANLSDAVAPYRITIRKGMMVRVTKGRPKGGKVGDTGEVFWLKDSPYGTKIGIGYGPKVTKRSRYGRSYQGHANVIWTYAHNVEPISTTDHRHPDNVEVSALLNHPEAPTNKGRSVGNAMHAEDPEHYRKNGEYFDR